MFALESINNSVTVESSISTTRTFLPFQWISSLYVYVILHIQRQTDVQHCVRMLYIIQETQWTGIPGRPCSNAAPIQVCIVMTLAVVLTDYRVVLGLICMISVDTMLSFIYPCLTRLGQGVLINSHVKNPWFYNLVSHWLQHGRQLVRKHVRRSLLTNSGT